MTEAEEDRLRKSAEIAVELWGGTVEGWLADMRRIKAGRVTHAAQSAA